MDDDFSVMLFKVAAVVVLGLIVGGITKLVQIIKEKAEDKMNNRAMAKEREIINNTNDQKTLIEYGVSGRADSQTRKTAFSKITDVRQLLEALEAKGKINDENGISLDGELRNDMPVELCNAVLAAKKKLKDAAEQRYREAVNKEKKEKRDFLAMINAPAVDADELVTKCAEMLAKQYETHPRGFLLGSSDAALELIRQIGEALDTRGGMELMLKTHQQFAVLAGGIPGAPRNLEICWDRIGGWQG